MEQKPARPAYCYQFRLLLFKYISSHFDFLVFVLIQIDRSWLVENKDKISIFFFIDKYKDIFSFDYIFRCTCRWFLICSSSRNALLVVIARAGEVTWRLSRSIWIWYLFFFHFYLVLAQWIEIDYVDFELRCVLSLTLQQVQEQLYFEYDRIPVPDTHSQRLREPNKYKSEEKIDCSGTIGDQNVEEKIIYWVVRIKVSWRSP